MALKAAPENPILPAPPRPDAFSIVRWGGDLIQSLYVNLKAIAYRVNRVLPKDGSERMTGALPLVSQNPLVPLTLTLTPDVAAGQLGYDSGANAVEMWNGAAWVAIGGGGGGAPTNAQYVVMALDATLTNERNLVVTAPLTLADGGANAPVTLGVSTGPILRALAGLTDPTMTLIGDVTGSGQDDIAATIEPNAVTNVKAADMPALTVKGNLSGVTADPSDVTLAALKASLGLAGSNTGDQTTTLTGDVTGSGQDLLAVTIEPRAVTYAKMTAATAANLLLGRGSAGGGGDWQEITLGGNMTMTGTVLDSTAAGGSGLTHPQVIARVSMRA